MSESRDESIVAHDDGVEHLLAYVAISNRDVNVAHADAIQPLTPVANPATATTVAPPTADNRPIYRRGARKGEHLKVVWLPPHNTAEKFKEGGIVRVVGATIRKRLAKLAPPPPSRRGIGGNNRVTTFFSTVDSFDAVTDLAELDRLDRRLDSSGTIVLQAHNFDPQKPHPLDTATAADVGKVFATLPIIAASEVVSEPVAARNAHGAKRIAIRLVTGRPAFAYEVEPITSRLQHKLTNIRKTRTVQVDENGYYVDPEDKSKTQWCTLNAFWDGLDEATKAKSSLPAIAGRAKNECQSLDALDREKRPKCKIYPVAELKNISIFTNEKVTGPDGFYHEKETGKQWGAFKRWLGIYRVSKRALEYGIEQAFGGLEQMTRSNVLDATRKEVEMLEKKDVEIALAYIFDAEILEVNNVHTQLEEVGAEIRESVFVTMNELAELIPFDKLKPAYMKSHLAAHKIDALERASGVPVKMYSLHAATSKFHDRIAALLAAIETTDTNDEIIDEKGRWITISKFLNECHAAEKPIENPRRFIANTDQTQRIRRMNSQNALTYLYLESELLKVAESLKPAEKAA